MKYVISDLILFSAPPQYLRIRAAKKMLDPDPFDWFSEWAAGF